MELRNNTDLEFTDISSEEWRKYVTPFGTYDVQSPTHLNVSENGHRILDAEGVSHFIDTSKGFFISWKAIGNNPHFVK
jgi:hypothetical protein